MEGLSLHEKDLAADAVPDLPGRDADTTCRMAYSDDLATDA